MKSTFDTTQLRNNYGARQIFFQKRMLRVLRMCVCVHSPRSPCVGVGMHVPFTNCAHACLVRCVNVK